MRQICSITVNTACPGKVVGVKDPNRRKIMKQTERQWMQSVKNQYTGNVVQGEYRVEVEFSRTKWAGNSPDIDNMLKVVFDSIKEHIITDDRHISQVEAKKVTGADSTSIRVYW
jgi:Holliday junction resolvase RusA-like endonuclease